MAELDKVIKGLECCSEKQNCKDCPYFKFSASCQDDMNKDALELLKEYKQLRLWAWHAVKEQDVKLK